MLIALFSQYLKNFKVPFPGYNKEQGGCYMGRSAIFRLFPVSKASLLSIVSLREDQWRKIGKLPYKRNTIL